MKELTIATGNRHKTEEFRSLLGAGWIIKDLGDYPEIEPAEETGTSFAENAILKAVALSRAVDGLVLADDSGLEVDALGGAPGVRSARYAGEAATDEENVALLLRTLRDSGTRGKRRTARFRCVLVVASLGELQETMEGVVQGIISNTPRGSSGFGYDPVFIPQGHCQTFAQLGPDVKREESHRARALAQLRESLDRYLIG